MSYISPSNYLLSTSRDYAIYVCDSRGIPYVGDGLKHVQRMALWMLRDHAGKIKTFALSGLLGASKIHCHGEKSSNDAIGLLAAPYRNNNPLIEGLGQFGSRIAPDRDGIGAPRYTEVRRARVAEAVLYNDIDLVPLEDNYDGSTRQPMHFLPLIPTVLLNGVAGVAVGWSTEILPRSLKSLIDATRTALLGHPIQTIEPYYARYGTIQVRATGKTNQWELTGRATVTDTSTVRITELPPGIGIEEFRKRLDTMENADVIQGYTDRSSDSIDITVRMKRGAIRDWKEADAQDFFRLRDRLTERIVTLDWGRDKIRVYASAGELVSDFARWRLGWYTRRFEKLLADALQELPYWLALRQLFKIGFAGKLGTFSNRTAMQDDILRLLDGMVKVDDSHIDRIVTLATYRWTEEFAAEVDGRIAKLNEAVTGYRETLASPEKLRDVYIGELDALLKL